MRVVCGGTNCVDDVMFGVRIWQRNRNSGCLHFKVRIDADRLVIGGDSRVIVTSLGQGIAPVEMAVRPVEFGPRLVCAYVITATVQGLPCDGRVLGQ